MNRDLDGMIAEEIYGWKETTVGPDAHGENACSILTPHGELDLDLALPPLGKIHRAWMCPQWSSDWYRALDLAKHVALNLHISQIPQIPEGLAQLCLDHFRKDKARREPNRDCIDCVDGRCQMNCGPCIALGEGRK